MYNYTHHYFPLNFINPLFLYLLYFLLLLQRQLFVHLLVLLSFLLLSPSYLVHVVSLCGCHCLTRAVGI